MLGREVPSFSQFGTVQRGPLYDEPAHSRRQLARDNGKALDRDESSLVPITNMEMGRTVVIVIERNDDPKKAA
jgi:hypothetical protein